MVARAADWCGMAGDACVFGEADAGRPVRLKGKQARCTFCDAEALTAACATAAGRDKLVPRLRRMAVASREKAVEERIAEEFRAHFRRALAGAPGRGLQRASRKRPAVAADTWEHVVGKRSSHTAPTSASAKKKYRQEVLDDRARARRHFGLAGRAVRGEEVSNDTGLPPPKRSKLALDIYNWCCNTLWGMCRVCSSMVPMPLTPSRLSNFRPSPWATLSECSRCQATDGCSYRGFEKEHKKFLGKHPATDARSRRRRLAYIETPGVRNCRLAPPLLPGLALLNRSPQHGRSAARPRSGAYDGGLRARPRRLRGRRCRGGG